MTNHYSTQNSHDALPVVCRTGGLIGALMLSGLLLASCGSDVADLGATGAVLRLAADKTEAAVPLHHQRFDHSVVNQRSTWHDSDLPGASIAAYGN